MGKIIAPISLVLVFDSIINKIKSKHQSKNRSDSYKLLKGKYPEIIQRKPKTTKSKKFEETIPTQHKFFKIGNLGYFIQTQ